LLSGGKTRPIFCPASFTLETIAVMTWASASVAIAK
jgi:hypothetical protein